MPSFCNIGCATGQSTAICCENPTAVAQGGAFFQDVIEVGMFGGYLSLTVLHHLHIVKSYCTLLQQPCSHYPSYGCRLIHCHFGGGQSLTLSSSSATLPPPPPPFSLSLPSSLSLPLPSLSINTYVTLPGLVKSRVLNFSLEVSVSIACRAEPL